VAAASGETFDNISPINGKVLTKVSAGDREDIDRAVKAAVRPSKPATGRAMVVSARSCCCVSPI